MDKAERVRIIARGAVQGVGFRPFVFRLATELGLNGWVLNSPSGVFIEAEATRETLRLFLLRLEQEKPPRAIIQSLETVFLDPVGYAQFQIRESENGGKKTALILPDIATCADCLREIFDPANRRYRYPFTNCTNCGPRFSIIEALPYDRANTSMKKFAMCAECAAEYHDPRDRRFHAQPNACPRCGPQFELWNGNGAILSQRDETLRLAADEIRKGKVVALKGLGGFQLIVDARSDAAINRLRERKHREEKPFAVMFPSLTLVRERCHVSALEERLLLSPECPIVLLPRRSEFSPSLAPGNPNVGAMLPYTPLHHLLMRELAFPVVATSGNLGDEPICIDESDALKRLRGIADFFLVHDRPVARHVDDSIVRVMCGRELVLRRARGFAPLPIRVKAKLKPTLALGAHLKNTIALGFGGNVFTSQHIGDLATSEAHGAFLRSAADLPHLYGATPEIIAHDLHPDYLSTKHAHDLAKNQSTITLVPVQHHYAHVAASMAENEIEPPALGVSWDGTGYGLDGTIWGGEFLLVHKNGFRRAAHLRQFRLPGGDAAIKEPRRSALGLLYELFGEELWDRFELISDFSESEIRVLRQMLRTGNHAPITSSAGRLFDAVAAIIGLRKRASFEGQAAMQLEFAIDEKTITAYPFHLSDDQIIDWSEAILAIIQDVRGKRPIGEMAACFHHTMIEMIVAVAQRLGEGKVVLSGGCFQNRYLTEHAVARLREENFQPYWHQHIPPNDGGISLGQVIAANSAPSCR